MSKLKRVQRRTITNIRRLMPLLSKNLMKNFNITWHVTLLIVFIRQNRLGVEKKKINNVGGNSTHK